MVTYDLSKTTQYRGFNVILTHATGNTTTKVTLNPKTRTPGQAPTLQFNGRPIKIGDYQPTDKLTSVDVYFLKTSKGTIDELPFLLVFNESQQMGRIGATNKKVYHLNDPEGPDGLEQPNDWSQWEEFREAEEESQDVAILLRMMLRKMEDGLCNLDYHTKHRVYKILKREEENEEEAAEALRDREEGDSSSQNTKSERSRKKRAVGAGKGGSCPGSEPPGSDTTKEPVNNVIFGYVAGGTVVLAAVSAVGYLWHTIPTRTIRDLTAYF